MASSLRPQQMESSNSSTRQASSNVSGDFCDLSNASCEARQQFTCLYTKHKTQKRRVWHDGRLVLKSTRAVLYDANPAPGSSDHLLDECEVTAGQKQALLRQVETRLETDKFLVQVEGPWVKPTLLQQTSLAPKVSNSMQKLLSRKFQRPKAYIPPQPGSRQSRLHAILGKRKRPLQPGELERIHHGAFQPRVPPPPPQQQQQQYQQETNQNPNRGRNHFPMSMAHPTHPSLRKPTNPFDTKETQRTWEAMPNENQPPNKPQADEPDAFVFQPVLNSDSATPSSNVSAPREYGAPDALSVQSSNSELTRTLSKKGLEFASNEFNATSFYGLDEEEEEDSPQKLLQGIPSHESSQQNKISSDEKITTEVLQSSLNANKRDKVSGNQLLALFGASAFTPANEPPPPEDSSSNQTANQEVVFSLPRASQSSSDESSSEED